MEKATGVQLFKVWDQIAEPCKLAIIEKLAKWESQLMSIKFPADGCVYSRRSFPGGERMTNLPTDIDRSESYLCWSLLRSNLVYSAREFNTWALYVHFC